MMYLEEQFYRQLVEMLQHNNVGGTFSVMDNIPWNILGCTLLLHHNFLEQIIPHIAYRV